MANIEMEISISKKMFLTYLSYSQWIEEYYYKQVKLLVRSNTSQSKHSLNTQLIPGAAFGGGG